MNARWIGRFAALGLAALLTACSTPEPPPPPTTVALNITGGPTMNEGAPAQVKVYYLGSTAEFATGDFFALFDEPQATLGADLIAVDEYLVAPGATVQDSKSFDTPPAAIGAVAAFRSVDQPGWRASAPLVPNAENAVNVVIEGQTVTIGR